MALQAPAMPGPRMQTGQEALLRALSQQYEMAKKKFAQLVKSKGRNVAIIERHVNAELRPIALRYALALKDYVLTRDDRSAIPVIAEILKLESDNAGLTDAFLLRPEHRLDLAEKASEQAVRLIRADIDAGWKLAADAHVLMYLFGAEEQPWCRQLTRLIDAKASAM